MAPSAGALDLAPTLICTQAVDAMNTNQYKRQWMQFKSALKHHWGTFDDTVNYLNYQRRVKTCSRSQGTRTSLSAKPRNSMARKPIPGKLPTL